MGDQLRELRGDLNLDDIQAGTSPAQDHTTNIWTPQPDNHQMFLTERTRFNMNRHYDQVMQLTASNMGSFDYTNIIPQRGPIAGGVSITHRSGPNLGPPIKFGDDCKSIRPKCHTCTELDTLAFAGMDAITKVDRERRELMIQHLRRRIQHCGSQADQASQLAFNWHREGNNASLMMVHFNMAHLEADRRMNQQPPISKPGARSRRQSEAPEQLTYHEEEVIDNQGINCNPQPEVSATSTSSVTVTKLTYERAQHVPTAEATTGRTYTEAVKGGKRSLSVYPTTGSGSADLPPPNDANKRRNMTLLDSSRLLDPNYDPETERQSGGNLQTPRRSYSPITPEEATIPSRPGTPMTPLQPYVRDREQRGSNYTPIDQLAIIATQAGLMNYIQ